MDSGGVLEIAKAANQIGLVGLLAAIIVTGIKAMWVPGFAYREKKAERDEAVAALDRFVGIHEAQTRAMEELRRVGSEQHEEITALKDCIDRLTERMERRGRA